MRAPKQQIEYYIEQGKKIAGHLDELPTSRMRQVMKLRYAIGRKKPMSVREVAKKLKISSTRVHQLEEAGRICLKRYLN